MEGLESRGVYQTIAQQELRVPVPVQEILPGDVCFVQQEERAQLRQMQRSRVDHPPQSDSTAATVQSAEDAGRDVKTSEATSDTGGEQPGASGPQCRAELPPAQFTPVFHL